MRNADFRTVGDDGTPDKWRWVTHRPSTAPEFAVVTDSSGVRWARMRLAKHGGSYGALTQRVEGVKPGEWVLLHYRVRSRGADRRQCALVRLIWRNEKGVKLAREYVDDTARTRQECTVDRLYETPEGATSLQLDLIGRWGRGGHVSFADVSLRSAPAPPPRTCKIAVVQLMPGSPTTPDNNREAFAEKVAEAGRLGADLVVLGEGIAVVGTGKAMAEVAERVPGPTCEVLGAVARAHRLYVVAGLYERDGNFIYNTAVLIGRDGQLVGKYRKVHLPEGEMDEGITPGREHPVFELDLGRVGLQVCYDYAFPESARLLALAGAEVIACPIWGDPRAHRQAWEATARARALDNGVFFAGAIYGPARSMIVDPHGDILVDAAGKEGVYVAEVDLTPGVYAVEFGDDGLVWRYFKHVYRKERRPDTYGPIADW
jgi:predicted amidohydrolase